MIFITVDALRADHVGAYGSKAGLTPNMDAFARDATQYDDACVSAPWTMPSLASVLTGLSPSECGMKAALEENTGWFYQDAVLPKDAPLITERLRSVGYTTAAELTNPFLQKSRGWARGFDHFRNETMEGAPDASRAKQMTREALRWLRARPKQPFFFWVHYLDPHTPYDAPTTPKALLSQYPRMWQADRPKWYDQIRYMNDDLQSRYQLFCRKMYAEEVRYADRWLGELLKGIKAAGLYDNSLIVISADHGEELFEHGEFAHGHSMHREVLHVPLLVKWPQGVRADRRIRQTVSVSGLAGTFLDVGRAQSATRRLPGLPRRAVGKGAEVYSEAALYGKEQTALTIDRYRVIYHPYAKSARNQFEVYDRGKDPRERKNLVRTSAASSLRARLKQLTDKAHAEARKRYGADRKRSPRRVLTEKEKRQLRSLGYLGK
jgi:arylsulfatase